MRSDFVFANDVVIGNPNTGFLSAAVGLDPLLVFRRIWVACFGQETLFAQTSILQFELNDEVIDSVPLNLGSPAVGLVFRRHHSILTGFPLNARFEFPTSSHGLLSVSNSVNVEIVADRLIIANEQSIDFVHAHGAGLFCWVQSSNRLNPSYSEDYA